MNNSLSGVESESEIEQFMRAVARAHSSALLLDYDGTLAPFVVDRQRAFPYPGVTTGLRRILDSDRTRVIIVTGRNAHEIKPLLGINPVPEVWGSHGLERIQPDGSCEMACIAPKESQALEDAGRWLAREALQHLAEFKPGGIAVHWRGLPAVTTKEIRDQVLRGWYPIAQDGILSILEFDGGVEIRISSINKGHAVRTIVNEMGPDAPIAYLGDDTTDERAFDVLGRRGLSVLVRPEKRSTSARLWLKPPNDLLDFLARWFQAVNSRK